MDKGTEGDGGFFMLNLVPSVKKLDIKNGFLDKTTINYKDITCDSRIITALSKLPFDEEGTKIHINILQEQGEEYELRIDSEGIWIEASGPAGAFYAVQTLRQIWKHKRIPYLYIKDKPDFAYRGFYHDVTRGKVPTVETIKKLVDQMAYYKLNSLQVYVEHTFEFEECKELNQKTGYLTAEEIREIDRYARENFIEFIPSLATFGHLYELLEQDKYRHLRILKDFEASPNFWKERMAHHTIDPLEKESFELVKSLMEQYYPLFESDVFNICCDETFDLKNSEDYISFVKQIINYLQQKNKKIMMWADILLLHPETIELIPEDVLFLNWEYCENPSEDKILRFAKLDRKQIVCPGTNSWNRLCEYVIAEEQNISKMAEYGYKNGAIGVLNTNWGDWGNPCSLELSMYGMVLGAQKSWTVERELDEKFYEDVNLLLYEQENAIQYLKRISKMQDVVYWCNLLQYYFDCRFNEAVTALSIEPETVRMIQSEYLLISNELSGQTWKNDEFRQEMLISAEGICVMAELYAKIAKLDIDRVTDTKAWLDKYRNKWVEKNKESELSKIEEVFLYLDR